jgi:hypothetical protein
MLAELEFVFENALKLGFKAQAVVILNTTF